MITSVAMVFSVVLIEISIPLFYAITGKALSLPWGNFALLLIALGLIVALIAGIYPSLYLSSVPPVLALKDQLLHAKGLGTRRAFIVFQFVTSMALISASVIISQQLDFLQHKNLGFNPEEVIVLPIKDRSTSSNIPGKSYNQNPIYALRNPEERRDASEAMIDPDFLSVMNMALIDGRSFLKNNPADSNAFILNETAVNQLAMKNPIGKEIVWERDGGPAMKGPIVGVVKDFHFQSLHEPLRPLLMKLETRYNFVVVKANTTDFKTTIQDIEKTWRKFDDRFRFEFSFLDSQLNQLYLEEQNMVRVLDIFSFLGVAIASIGLLGIAALAFRQRTKEVSIRKVLGASLSNLILLLLKDFTKLVLIAVVLAVPLVWWVMNGWLQNFSYRITISPLVFIITGLSLVLIAWITLGFLTVKTANVNPAETLKSE